MRDMKYFLSILVISLAVMSIPAHAGQGGNHSRHSAELQNRASNQRSDTVDILHYTISLNITDFTTKVITGNTVVKLAPKISGVSVVKLDLLELAVDSIKLGAATLAYSYNDTLLAVNFPSPLNTGDTVDLAIFYHGVPVSDSQWGGFYFQDPYAYNLGVGFDALPHTFGRVWFPCFDNFVERSTYAFNITTSGGKIAMCNGILNSDVTDGSGNRTRQWLMNDPIPSYLASVAVAPYAEVHQTYMGINGALPIILAAVPSDTTAVKNSFINLPVALNTFETHFGPYMWDRVGYVMVPFNSGAMEHATNIAYPKATATGSTTYQNLYAHELSHHWFGDLATCRTAEDMWLNEGWAHYCEFLFDEALSGYNAYLNSVRVNHEDNLHFNTVKEGNLSLAAIPQSVTYGDHVYNKGADVAHTLRGYLGDSLFFYSVRTYLQSHNYKDVSSADFRDALSAASGVDLTDFFENWVFNPGWPHFSIDTAYAVSSGGGYNVVADLRQKLTGAPSYYTNVPLELTYVAADFTEQTKTFMMSGASQSQTFTLPFAPAYVAVNMHEKISDATAPEKRIIKTPGAYTFTNAKMNVTVQSMTDSAYLRIIHNYTAPDPFKTCCIPYRLSPNRYWRVEGIIPADFKAKAVIFYDGRTTAFSGTNYLDQDLINTFEDSLVLMYRRSPAYEWHEFPYITKNMLSSNNDKRGQITIDSLWAGEYVLAMKDPAMSRPEISQAKASLGVYPNPATEMINVTISGLELSATSVIEVRDVNGKLVHAEKRIAAGGCIISTAKLRSGTYTVTLLNGGQAELSRKFVVAH